MTASIFPRVIRDGLVVDYDPAYYTSFNSDENLLTYSDQFGTGWILDSATVTSNSIIAPDGTLTGDTLVSTITGGNNNAFATQQKNGLTTGLVYTYSVYVRAGTSPTTLIDFYVVTPYTEVTAIITWGGTTPSIVYNGSALISGTFDLVSNGWYRVSLTMSIGTGTAMTQRVYIRGQGTNNVSGETVYAWGAQLERSRTSNKYVTTTTTAVTRSTTLNNLVSTSYPGTLVGNVAYNTQGQGSLYFNEIDSEYISMYTLPAAFWNAGSWTVSAWYRPATTSKSFGDHGILGHGAVSFSQGLHLGIRNTQVYFGFYGNDANSSVGTISANTWYHIVWVYDFIQAQRIIYVNGIAVYTQNLTGNAGYGYSGTGTNTQLGRYPWAPTNHMCSGNLGRVQIYNRVLSASEVSQIYSSMVGRYS